MMINRIEICGGIGSGKTTLAKQFENNQFCSVYESFDNNPFLHDFYMDPVKYAFETEVLFSLQRYHAIKKLGADNLVITDFSLEQDYAYAESNLTYSELLAFNTVLNEIVNQIGAARLIVYLKCPIDTLVERIDNRKRWMEQTIKPDYLEKMINGLEARLKASHINCITIDSGTLDFRKKNTFLAVKEIVMRKYEEIVGDVV